MSEPATTEKQRITLSRIGVHPGLYDLIAQQAIEALRPRTVEASLIVLDGLQARGVDVEGLRKQVMDDFMASRSR